MKKVLLLLGGGVGNIVHATPALQAIIGLGYDVTVWCSGEWPDLEKFLDHDKIVTGDVPDVAGFDHVIRNPFAFSGSKPWPKDRPVPEAIIKGDSPLPLESFSEVDSNMWFARTLGYDKLTPMPKIRHPETSSVSGNYIVIATGVQRALPVWLKKQYPHWHIVAKALFDKSIPVVFLGSKEDAEPWMDSYINLCGRTSLWDAAGVLYRARAVLGVDNGLTCLAAAMDVPTIALWGPTSQVKNRKYGRTVVDIAASLPCRPCQFHAAQFVQCQHMNCMRAIDPVRVVEVAMDFWPKETAK